VGIGASPIWVLFEDGMDLWLIAAPETMRNFALVKSFDVIHKRDNAD
jgi:hypothetical protein